MPSGLSMLCIHLHKDIRGLLTDLLRHAILSGSHVGSLLVRNAPSILCTQSPREHFVFENFRGFIGGILGQANLR